MGIQKKLKTGLKVLNEKGFSGLMRLVRHKLFPSATTDENQLIFDALHELIPVGVMVDVGAHHGYSLEPFAKAGWEVFAFEPDPKNRAQLLERASQYPNVHIDCHAVSNEIIEDASFYTSKESDGISGLSAFLPSHKSTATVAITTLEKVCDEMSVTKIDYLKIDAEGFDYMVLQGLPWEKVTPGTILCEFEDAKTLPLGHSFKILADYLVEKGYRLIVSEWKPIVKYGEQHTWRGYFTYPHNLKTEKAWGNLIATKDEKLYQRLVEKAKPR